MRLANIVDAKKHRIGREEALKLAKTADQLFVSKGTRVVHVDLKHNRPEDDSLVGLMLGPTGNLRAPTALVGKTMLVGFNEATYSDALS